MNVGSHGYAQDGKSAPAGYGRTPRAFAAVLATLRVDCARVGSPQSTHATSAMPALRTAVRSLMARHCSREPKRWRASTDYHFLVTTLVPVEKPDDHDLSALRARAGALEAVLTQRSADLARVRMELETFRIRYRQEVGTLHEQLDELELAIAEAELGELAKRVPNGADGASASTPTLRHEPLPRLTSDAVRKLFRDVAKAIHPDLARDEAARDRHHTLMVEANRAYALGDEEELRRILQAWERSPEAVQGSDPEAVRLRLARRVVQIEEQIDRLSADLGEIKDTPLWKLKMLVDEAAAKGRDLVREMVGRLKRDILVATNRLNAMRPPQ